MSTQDLLSLSDIFFGLLLVSKGYSQVSSWVSLDYHRSPYGLLRSHRLCLGLPTDFQVPSGCLKSLYRVSYESHRSPQSTTLFIVYNFVEY